MTRDQQRLADYLAHIAEAIERIDRYTEDMDEWHSWIASWCRMR